MKDKATKKIHLRGISDNGLYKLQSSSFPHAYLTTLHQWHARLGHHNFPVVKQLIQKFQLPCSKFSSSSHKCTACYLGKFHRLSLPMTNHRSSAPLDLIHSDVWGPAPLISSSGSKYFVIFIDDYSLFTWLFPIKAKSDFLPFFNNFNL